MNKRGLSEIVVVVLIILISIIAVMILFPIIKNYITKTTNNINPEQFTISLEMNKPINISGEDVTVTVKRNAGEGQLVAIKFTIENLTSSKSYDYDTTMTELETKTFTILDSNVTGITKVSITPILNQNGERKLGTTADTYSK